MLNPSSAPPQARASIGAGSPPGSARQPEPARAMAALVCAMPGMSCASVVQRVSGPGGACGVTAPARRRSPVWCQHRACMRAHTKGRSHQITTYTLGSNECMEYGEAAKLPNMAPCNQWLRHKRARLRTTAHLCAYSHHSSRTCAL